MVWDCSSLLLAQRACTLETGEGVAEGKPPRRAGGWLGRSPNFDRASGRALARVQNICSTGSRPVCLPDLALRPPPVSLARRLRPYNCNCEELPSGQNKNGGLVGVCAHSPDAVRTRGQEFSGAGPLALSALRLTTLAKTQGGASRRPSVLASWAHLYVLLVLYVVV